MSFDPRIAAFRGVFSGSKVFAFNGWILVGEPQPPIRHGSVDWRVKPPDRARWRDEDEEVLLLIAIAAHAIEH